MLGAFFFGWLTDRLGRKKLSPSRWRSICWRQRPPALSWNFWSFALFRFLTGAGIGGEYTAINSTIQELIPARLRGWTDLVINGSFWVGAAMGAGGSIVLLDPAFHRSGDRLAARIPDRRHNRTCHRHDANVDTRKPALAGDARFRAGRGKNRARHRSRAVPCAQRQPARTAGMHAYGLRTRESHAAARGRSRAVRDLSAAHAGRA